MSERPDKFSGPSIRTVHTFLFCLLLILSFTTGSLYAQSEDQSLTEEQKEKKYERKFGDEEDNVQTAAQAVRFANDVLQKVKRSYLADIQYYAHDRLRDVLSQYESDPDVLGVLIKINEREQNRKGFDPARNNRIIELLRKRGQVVQKSSEQLKILHRIIGAYRQGAQHALKEKNWDEALTDYERVVQISSNFDKIDQENSARKIIRRIKQRKQFESKTAKLIKKAVKNPSNGSVNRKAGEHLARLKRWSHALPFLQKAEESGSSTPLLQAVQIALTLHLQHQSNPETIGRYLLQLENVRKQLEDNELIRACLNIGSELFEKINKHRGDLTDAQKEDVNSIYNNWQKSLDKIGLNPVLSLSDESPSYLFYPRRGLEIYAPGNGSAKDFSGNNRNGVFGNGARVNLGEGFLGAYEFIGFRERWTNSVRFETMDSSLFTSSFTVSFWFKRDKFLRGTTLSDVGNVMFSLNTNNRDNAQLGTVGQFLQVYLNTKSRKGTDQMKMGIQDDTWYHLAMSFDEKRSKEVHIYLNGNLVGKSGSPKGLLRAQNSRLVLGNSLRRPAPFVGLIDDLFFYSRTLNPEEIQQLVDRPK